MERHALLVKTSQAIRDAVLTRDLHFRKWVRGELKLMVLGDFQPGLTAKKFDETRVSRFELVVMQISDHWILDWSSFEHRKPAEEHAEFSVHPDVQRLAVLSVWSGKTRRDREKWRCGG